MKPSVHAWVPELHRQELLTAAARAHLIDECRRTDPSRLKPRSASLVGSALRRANAVITIAIGLASR